MLYGHLYVSSFPEPDRARDLEIIKRRYAQYAGSDRYDLWSLSNPGFRRLVEARDDEIMRLLRKSLSYRSDQVLDLGAGSSRLAGAARQSGLECDWVGVDIDPASIAESGRLYPWARFVVASADRLPIESDTVDVAIASVLFSSIPSAEFEEAIAAELARVIRPGGWLIWYDLRFDNPANRGVHGLGRSRIERLFPKWSSELRSFTLAPPIARRLGRTSPVTYPILAAVPFLRSHLIGRLRCPT
jgi:ubiquinone/menaquinone biosynthesis C-methylase UbiE